MTKTKKMQEKDKRMFGTFIRERVYRGEDGSFANKRDITVAEAKDHGARPLLGKFSEFNLSYLNPEQRKLFVEQMKYELSLKGQALNEYLDARYDSEDEYQVWLMHQQASRRRSKALGLKKPNAKGRKKKISLKAKRRKMTPEQIAARTAKAKATRERNKHDPNYVSYGTLKRDFLARQKLLAARYEAKAQQAVELFAEPTIRQQVQYRTVRLERENQQLKEYLKQNNLPLPGTAAAKKRREALRHENS